VTSASAFAVNNPAVKLLIVNVHVTVAVPNPLGAPQVELCEPGPGDTVVVIAAAVIGWPPIECTVIWKSCGVPTSFDLFGVIDTFASTYSLNAESVPPSP